MNRFLYVLFFVLLVPWYTLSQSGWRPGEMEARVILRTSDDIAILKGLKINDEPVYGVPLSARVYITPDELIKLRASGLEFTITQPDLNASSLNFWDQPALESYHNYTQLVALADSLATSFPAICKKILLGTSYQDHQLAILKISDNVNVNENEAEIMFDGGIHGDEIMGPEILIRYARELCIGYGNNPTYTDLINNREIWIYYLCNPDGFVNGSRYNANGVDCNRDIGFMWNGGGNSTAPFSQMESRLLRQLWLEHNFTVYTNFHGGSEVISFPWSYRSATPPDYNHLNQLASVYSSASGYYNLPYGQGFIIMYQIFGSTKDFTYGALGQVGWSIEITQQKQPPSSQIPMYYNYNVPAMTELIKRSGWGIEGTITDSVTGSPVKASVFIGPYYPVYTDIQLGDFHKYILPGTYTVKVKAGGYQTKVIPGVTVPAQGSVVVNIQLSPNPKWYALKTLVTNIPFFPVSGNYYDESYVPGVIGSPDSVNYSIGRSGYIVLDMGDTIFNGNGYDFKVFEGDNTPEGYSCAVSLYPDGPWTDLGTAVGTTSFNLSGSSVSEIRYIQITDDGDGVTNVDNAGFDLDAVEILTPPLIADFTATNNTPCMGTSINFFDESSGNPTAWLWEFPGATPATSTLQNPVNILYSSPGWFDVTLTVMNAFSMVTLTKANFIHVGTIPQAPATPTGPDTVCCNTVSQYTTNGSSSATSFIWNLWPPEAGSVAGAWITGTVDWNDTYSGLAWLKVKEITACGEGPYSDSIQIGVFPAPDTFLGSDTTLCPWESVILDAGNPGCTFLWSNGASTQTIQVDTSGFGIGIHPIWVTVADSMGCSDSDTVVVTIDACSGISKQTNDPGFLVYPNPNSGSFTIRITIPSEVEWTVTNLQGTAVQHGVIPAGQQTCRLVLSEMAHGVYLLYLSSPKHMCIQKLIIY